MQIGPIVVTNWWGMMFVAITVWSIVQLITVGVIAEIKKPSVPAEGRVSGKRAHTTKDGANVPQNWRNVK